ncbi:hypothetical protein MBLNU13_g06721t1 [Cladosporium sp. NU13]
MIPFVYVPVTATRRQSSNNDSQSFHSSYSSHGAPNITSQHHGMPLGDLEAGHGQVTYPHCTPPPSDTGSPLPSTPPPLYHGVPLPCAPAPNALRPYVNHQIPRRPVPRPSPPRRSPRRRRCGPPRCGRTTQDDKFCAFLFCFLACAVMMVVFPLVVLEYGKHGHKGQQSEIHCRGVVVVPGAAAAAAAAGAAHGGCG